MVEDRKAWHELCEGLGSVGGFKAEENWKTNRCCLDGLAGVM